MASGTRTSQLVRPLAIIAGGLILCGAPVGLLLLNARPFALARLSQRVGRPVRVDGKLSLHPTLASLTIRFSRLHVDQAAWAGRGPMVWVDRGAVTLPWSAVLGDVRLQDVKLQGVRLVLRRDAQGRASWSDGAPRRAPRLPRIARITVHDARLDYRDLSRALTFQGAVTVTPNASGAPVLSVDGHGRSEDGVWTLAARSTTDFAGDTPYVLSAHLVLDRPSGRSVAELNGHLRPSGGGRLQGVAEGSGPDLHDLSHLINVPLPHTPPYRLRTRIDRTQEAVRIDQLVGRVGQSDLSGGLTITPRPGERHVDGVLHSRSLRMFDLLSVASGGKLTAAHQAGQLLPTATINPVPLRKLTGAIRFSAASVQAPTTPTIRSLQLRATFDRGRIAADPMLLSLEHGLARVRFVLDVRGPVPRVRLDTDLDGADTADFRNASGAPAPLQANFDGAIHLQGAGPSLSAAAAHADGEVRLRALNGRLRQTQAAVLSADFVRGVTALLSHSRADAPMSCAVARFQVSDGKGRATALRMVTSLGGVTGYGGFDLAAQTLDITLRPMAKDAAGASSVRLDGPIAHPRATLAVDNPTGLVRHALTSLLHPEPPGPGGCR